MKYKAHILVVDDEEDARSAARVMLEKQGYSAFSAAGGGEALEYLKLNKVDIIICDIEMPDMTGFEVLEEVKKQYPDIIFAVMTGYRDAHSVGQALLKGADEYIGKPFTARELALIVERLCWRLSCGDNPPKKTPLATVSD